MKAMIYNGPFDMGLKEIPIPAYSSNEVLLKVKAVGICGSDIHGFSGKTGRRVPGMVMGHEISGEIIAVGNSVTEIRIGEHIVVQPIISCGECICCKEGKTSICLYKKMVGVNMGVCGGLCEYLAIPEKNIFKINPNISYTTAALTEAIAVGESAARQAEIKRGDTVCIVGAGVIGISILYMALKKLPEKVLIIDNNKVKLDFAAGVGAIPVNFDIIDPVNAVLTQTDRIGADITIEAVGNSPAVKTAQYALRPGGTGIWIGNNHKEITLDMQDIVTKAKRIKGVYCYENRDFSNAINYLENNEKIAEKFVEKRCSLKEAPALFTALANGEITLFRGMVTM